VANITSADFGNYTPRVISYDANNPTSFAATTASLTAAASCGGNTSTNLALNKPVTASSFIAAGYEPAKVNDGNNIATRWASGYSGSQWIQVDLGSSYNINRVKVTWENAYATNYQILTSADGLNWAAARVVNGNSTLVNDNTGLTTTGRYVRIYGTANALPAWGYSMYELEVYGAAATTNSNRALNKMVTVSSVEAAGLEGNKAVDGNGTSRWASAYTDTQWLQVDLGATYSVSRVKISWEAAYGKNFKIQISPNGTAWTDLKSVSNNTTLVNDFAGLSGSGRYIRISGTKRATAYGYSIYELEVY
ncbi:MAG: discoidin domain-containing protein, partial [Moraxellaceae bacterium]